MKPSTELFDLIHSLNKSEKRFFKLHSSLQSGEKNYLKIFDVVDKQKEYDEEAIKEKFKNETFVKHFPSEKNHLYKLILKALRAYHSDSTVSGQLKQEIKNIEILYKKALYKECNKFLHRAKRIAKEHERFYYYFELLSWEKMLLEESFASGEFTKDLDALIEEEQEVVEKLRNLAAYHILYSKINYVFRSGGYVRTEHERALVEEIANHPLIVGKNTALSKRAATICYYTQGFCNWAKRDFKTSYEKFSRACQILEETPKIRKELGKRYIRTIYYIVNCEIELGMFDQAVSNIEKIRELGGQKGFGSLDLKMDIFRSSTLAEMRLMDRRGAYDTHTELVERVMEGLDLYGSRLPKEHELEFSYALSCIYFGGGQTNKALFWLNKVLNDNESTLRQDIYTYARLFNLVIHFELGNFDLLEYIVRSTQRFLNKKKKAFDVETLLIDHVKKLAKISDEEKKMKQFKLLRDDLEKLFKDPNERLMLKYFDFLSWVNAHINGTSFAEAVRSSGKRGKAAA